MGIWAGPANVFALWGGRDGSSALGTGAYYSPSSNSWLTKVTHGPNYWYATDAGFNYKAEAPVAA
jgi:hypothetical protein